MEKIPTKNGFWMISDYGMYPVGPTEMCNLGLDKPMSKINKIVCSELQVDKLNGTVLKQLFTTDDVIPPSNIHEDVKVKYSNITDLPKLITTDDKVYSCTIADKALNVDWECVNNAPKFLREGVKPEVAKKAEQVDWDKIQHKPELIENDKFCNLVDLCLQFKEEIEILKNDIKQLQTKNVEVRTIDKDYELTSDDDDDKIIVTSDIKISTKDLPLGYNVTIKLKGGSVEFTDLKNKDGFNKMTDDKALAFIINFDEPLLVGDLHE